MVYPEPQQQQQLPIFQQFQHQQIYLPQPTFQTFGSTHLVPSTPQAQQQKPQQQQQQHVLSSTPVGRRKAAAASTIPTKTVAYNKNEQVECCLNGCSNTVTNRLRFSLRCVQESDFKCEHIERGWNRVCHYHYFNDLYKFKKFNKTLKKDQPANTNTSSMDDEEMSDESPVQVDTNSMAVNSDEDETMSTNNTIAAKKKLVRSQLEQQGISFGNNSTFQEQITYQQFQPQQINNNANPFIQRSSAAAIGINFNSTKNGGMYSSPYSSSLERDAHIFLNFLTKADSTKKEFGAY